MRILKLQNTILVSLLVTGAATVAACGSSDASRPTTDATAGAGDTTSGAGTGSSAGGSGNAAGGSTSSTAGSTSVAGTTSGVAGSGSGGAAAASVCDGAGSRVLTLADSYIENFETVGVDPTTMMPSTDATFAGSAWYSFNDLGPPGADSMDST